MNYVFGAAYELSVRIAQTGGPVRPSVEHPPRFAAPPSGHIVLLVHGYNNNMADARAAYSNFLDNLDALLSRGDIRTGGAKPDVGKFFWPGDANLWIFSFLSYPTEISDAKESAQVFARFLAGIPGLREVSLVGHSMGCRLVLEMLSLYARGDAPGFPKVRFLLLAAAAVPVELVESGGELRAGVVRADPRVLVLYSPDDPVLRFAFPAGQSLAFAMGHESKAYFSAVGLNGSPQSFGSSRKQLVGARHGDYWPSESVARDLMTLLGVPTRHEVPSQAEPVHRMPGYRAPDRHSLRNHILGR